MRVMAHWRLLAVSHLGLPSMLTLQYVPSSHEVASTTHLTIDLSNLSCPTSRTPEPSSNTGLRNSNVSTS